VWADHQLKNQEIKMVLKKITIMTTSLILSATSFVIACDGRQMDRQNNKIQLRQQRFLDRQVSMEPFRFTPRFRGDTFQAQLMLGLMIGACIIGGVDASSDQPPSSGSAQRCMPELDSMATSDSLCVADDFGCMAQAQELSLSQIAKGVVLPGFVQDFIHPGQYTRQTDISTAEEATALRVKDFEMAKKEEGFVTPTGTGEQWTSMLRPRWRKLYKSYGSDFGNDAPVDRSMAQKAYNFATKTLYLKPLEKWQLSDLISLNNHFSGNKLAQFRNGPIFIRNTENGIPGFFVVEFPKYLLKNNPEDLPAYLDLAEAVRKSFGDIKLKQHWDFVIAQSFNTGESSPHYAFLSKYYTYNAMDSSEITKRMGKLLTETKRLFKEDGIKAAGYFHMDLVNIHPWKDANGRVARLGLNLILIKSGYPAIAFTSDNRYTSAINRFNAGNKDAFEAFIKEEICRTTGLYRDPEFRDGKPFRELVEKCKIADCEAEFEKLREAFGL
jgi:Fic/DOC family